MAWRKTGPSMIAITTCCGMVNKNYFGLFAKPLGDTSNNLHGPKAKSCHTPQFSIFLGLQMFCHWPMQDLTYLVSTHVIENLVSDAKKLWVPNVFLSLLSFHSSRQHVQKRTFLVTDEHRTGINSSRWGALGKFQKSLHGVTSGKSIEQFQMMSEDMLNALIENEVIYNEIVKLKNGKNI